VLSNRKKSFIFFSIHKPPLLSFIPIILETGDLLLFHSFLMHKSYDNNSKLKRTTVVFHFAETGTKYGEIDSPTNEWISVRGCGLEK
jgi:ectoine hydroxylase-related dioxygenase (phytanoyl-CoA dioxygenase family)